MTAAVMGKLDWQAKAACEGMDRELFFPEEDFLLEPEVLAACAICTVREDCLAFAIEYGQDFGVWGGLTEKQRKKINKVANRAHCPGCYSEQIIEQAHSEVCINCGLSWSI